MISNGALNGSPVGKYPPNGGGIVGEATGSSTSANASAGRLTARRMAVASAVVKIKGEWLSVTGIAKAAIRVSGRIIVRKITSGAIVSSAEIKGGAIRRPVASATASTAFAIFGRALRKPVALGNSNVAVAAAGKILRRPITSGRSAASVHFEGKALRRPIATAAIAIVFGHLAQAGYLYFRPTDRRRIVSVFERRHTQIAADYRTVPIHRDNREIIIPREAGI